MKTTVQERTVYMTTLSRVARSLGRAAGRRIFMMKSKNLRSLTVVPRIVDPRNLSTGDRQYH